MGLKKLTNIDGDLQIGYNEALTSLDGLEKLDKIGGFLTIFENSSLKTCCELLPLLDKDEMAGQTTIGSNAEGCNSEAEIKESCPNPGG